MNASDPRPVSPSPEVRGPSSSLSSFLPQPEPDSDESDNDIAAVIGPDEDIDQDDEIEEEDNDEDETCVEQPVRKRKHLHRKKVDRPEIVTFLEKFRDELWDKEFSHIDVTPDTLMSDRAVEPRESST